MSGPTLTQIEAAFQEVEAALDQINESARGSEELHDISEQIVWDHQQPKAIQPKEAERLMRVINAYHAVWQKMTACPIAAIALAPVSVLRRPGQN